MALILEHVLKSVTPRDRKSVSMFQRGVRNETEYKPWDHSRNILGRRQNCVHLGDGDKKSRRAAYKRMLCGLRVWR